jgi:hypothetical protein
LSKPAAVIATWNPRVLKRDVDPSKGLVILFRAGRIK